MRNYRRFKAKPLLGFAWFVLVQAACAAAPLDEVCWSAHGASKNDTRLDPIRRKMQRTVADGSAPSIAVSVALEGRIIWEGACGQADRDRSIRATPQTAYAVGSISKTFTATGLMVLVERGLVDLGRSANDYLGPAKLTGLDGDPSAATVKLVMQHRAGLPMHANFFYENEKYRRPPMEETIRRYGILVRPPGEAYNYANLGYGILEYIIARVSGSSYEDFMRREVFLPLGLTHTAVGPPPELQGITAALYEDDRRLPNLDLDQRGAGYIYSSAHDLVRFGMFHLKEHRNDQRQILKASTIETMVNDASPTGTDTWAYGLGWDIHSNEYGSGLTSVRHTGAMAGAAAVLKLIPEKQIVVAVVSNSRRAGTVSLSEDIVAALVPAYGKQRDLESARNTEPSPEPFRPGVSLLGVWQGVVKTWKGELPVRMEIKPDGDIHIKLGDQLETVLNDTEFSNGELSGSFQGAIPTEDADRDRHSVYLDRLVLRGETLSGAAIADGGAHYALPSWIKLVRQESKR